MQSKKTPKWLQLFITAFGAKGLVALAWWLGSLHAERIRALHGSYPFLEVTGAAGAGKSVLTQMLWKLIGADQAEAISATKSTPLAFLRRLNGAVNWPVVIEDTSDAEPFDWDLIKDSFRGGMVSVRSGGVAEELKFQGALVIIGGTGVSGSLESRMVVVQLERALHTQDARLAIEALFALPVQDYAEFLTRGGRSDAFTEQFFSTTTSAFIECLQEDTEHSLSDRDALNHAQIRTLLVVLDALFGLPTDISQTAHAEVHNMTWQACVPY